jgi:arylsulfatase A-like enzyme
VVSEPNKWRADEFLIEEFPVYGWGMGGTLAGSRVLRGLGTVIAAAIALGCVDESGDLRPSVLLVVVDTLRADAVSAYGHVHETTPHFDALATSGLLYSHAFSPSPWTLPSHASILTGLAIDQHGVGIGGRMGLREDVETLAERLTAAGYQTAGFSENPLISDGFGMDQGFDHFATVTIEDVMNDANHPGSLRFDTVASVSRFLEGRDKARPFFVFVNLFDPHSPYEDRERDQFVPPELQNLKSWTPRRLRRSPYAICSRLPGANDLAILRGLYLGDVAQMDQKIGRIATAAREASEGRVIVVATADHGEQFGEHRLLDHEFTVRAQALRVPLAVQGLPGIEPARIDAAVELADIAPSILSWAGVRPVAGLRGRILPTGNSPRPPAEMFAVYSDQKLRTPDDWESELDVDAATSDAKRAGCGESDRVFGNMAALTRWPFKLIWFQNYAPELYDLSWDPEERSDLAELRPEITAKMLELVRVRLAEVRLETPGSTSAARPAPEDVEALEALGYLD